MSEDYVARVEPSAFGGKKMAEYLLDIIDGRLPNDHMAQPGYTAPAPLADRMNVKSSAVTNPNKVERFQDKENCDNDTDTIGSKVVN